MRITIWGCILGLAAVGGCAPQSGEDEERGGAVDAEAPSRESGAGHDAASPSGYAASTPDAPPPLDVDGWTHVYVGPDGVDPSTQHPRVLVTDRIWVFDRITLPVSSSCTCPPSFTTNESTFANAVPYVGGGCATGARVPLSGGSCTPLYLDPDGGTGGIFPGRFQSARVDTPASTAASVSGYAANDAGYDVERNASVDVWRPFFDDPATGAFVDCQLASGERSCPAGYPARRVMYAVADDRDCACAASIAQTPPSIGFYAKRDCTGDPVLSVPVTDGTCNAVTVPDNAMAAQLRTTATVTIGTTPTYSGAVSRVPWTLCCP